MDKILQEQEKKSPQDYQQVIQSYRSIADKTGDQRAQMALANMYAEGRGTWQIQQKQKNGGI